MNMLAFNPNFRDMINEVVTKPPSPSTSSSGSTSPTSSTSPTRNQLVHLNWSYFKPEFAGKLNEDAEAHLLNTNDWMNAHHFIDGVKVQRFCLTLLCVGRLWYQSSETMNADWQELENLFR